MKGRQKYFRQKRTANNNNNKIKKFKEKRARSISCTRYNRQRNIKKKNLLIQWTWTQPKLGTRKSSWESKGNQLTVEYISHQLSVIYIHTYAQSMENVPDLTGLVAAEAHYWQTECWTEHREKAHLSWTTLKVAPSQAPLVLSVSVVRLVLTVQGLLPAGAHRNNAASMQ